MPAERDPLVVLVSRLRGAGLEPTPEELADALWLSRWSAPSVPLNGPRVALDRRDPAVLAEEEPAPQDRRRPSDAPPQRLVTAEGDLYAVPSPGDTELTGLPPGGLMPVRVPVASALPGLLPLQRALRPLQRYRPPLRPVRYEIDETATAEATAESGMIIPVVRGIVRRESTMQLLMDVSSSTAVWEQMLEELRQVCIGTGAFRDVQVHFLHEGRDGTPGINNAAGPQSALRHPDQLRDPTGRRLTLVLSDCAGPMWRSGRLQRLLHHWATTAPVAVVQPLPQRMWGRTHLPAAPGVLRRRDGLGGRLEFWPAGGQGMGRPALPVPVLAPTRASLGSWARLVSGTTGLSLNAAAAWVLPGHPEAAARIRRVTVDAGELTRTFRMSATPEASQLAVYLSAAPLVLPVMQLVQRAMLPHTSPSVLAEVLLSGLVIRAGDGLSIEPGGPWYEFAPGVRDLLMRRLSIGDASLVLKHCSQYVERNFGRRARNFPALAAAYLSGSALPATRDDDAQRAARTPQPFARVSEKVLRRFLPTAPTASPTALPPQLTGSGPDALADRYEYHLARFRAEGTVRDLAEAIQLLRAAVTLEQREARRSELCTQLAETLVLRWTTRHDLDVLREAREAAEQAGTAHAARAAAVRGRVYQELAFEAAAVSWAPVAEGIRDAAGLPRHTDDRDLGGEDVVLTLLTLADEAFAEVTGTAAAPSEADALLDATLRRVVVLRAIGERVVARDTLREALIALDAYLDRTPSDPGRPRPPEALLERGRVLLDLARRADGQEAADLARQAELDLAAATESELPPATLSRATLDHAEARYLATGRYGDAVLDMLQSARYLAAGARALEAEALSRLGQAHHARYALSAEAGELDLAERAFAAAQRLVPPDDAAHAELLTSWGDVLIERAALENGAFAADEAVRVLREAVAETGTHHPRIAGRLLSFGRALLSRYDHAGASADLHEADWILSRSARSASDPRLAATAWLARGDCAVALAARTGARSRKESAADSYRLAAENAILAQAPLLAAQAHHKRGEILETTAGRRPALEAYRLAAQQWERAGTAAESDAHRTLDRIRALERHG
ncbi:SAV_2336 N-terminal domain-related protein [Streptomyces sp. NPDC059373]